MSVQGISHSLLCKIAFVAMSAILVINPGWAVVIPTAPVTMKEEVMPSKGPMPIPKDGKRYRLHALLLRYSSEHPEHPPLSDLNAVQIKLLPTPMGWVAPRPDIPTELVSVGKLREMPDTQWFYGSALTEIARAIVTFFNERDIYGVEVRVDASQISDRGTDLRSDADSTLTMVITTAVIGQVRTLNREQGLQSAQHQAITRGSPLQPGTTNQGALLRKEVLENYVNTLSGANRNVSVEVSPTQTPGVVSLNYLVAELKPWNAYVSIENTGTPSVGVWQKSVGFIHNGLTGHGDTFAVNLTSSDFQNYNSLNLLYDIPIYRTKRWRLKSSVAISSFQSSQFGTLPTEFSGHQQIYEPDLYCQVYNGSHSTLNLWAGIAYERIFASNLISKVVGTQRFLLPKAGFTGLTHGDFYLINANADIQTTINGFMASRRDTISALGRTETSTHWTIANWNIFSSIYLDRWVYANAIATEVTPQHSMLAHEVTMQLRGQYTFKKQRLPPQFEGVIGGLHTVRGYPEALAAGDSDWVFNFEYLFHLPQAFKIEPIANRQVMGRPFHAVAPRQYGRADWDLIFRGFLDIGHTTINRRFYFESTSANLMGGGGGVEFHLFNNLIIRTDVGWVMREALGVQKGFCRINFALSWFF